MARTENKAIVNNFIGGLVSDYHELNTPPNTTINEDNCDLDRRGSRKRRLGIDFEDNFQPSTASWTTDQWPDIYIKTFVWKAVAEDGTRNFLVAQGGHILSFYDMSSATLSEGELPFTVNLDDFRVASYYSTDPYGVQVAYGKGALFVVGEAITPFYIQYDKATNTITTTAINIRIRDLALQDHDMGLTDQFTTLTPEQNYDLFNQGWNVSNVNIVSTDGGFIQGRPFNTYRLAHGHYPQKAKSWWVGKTTNIKFGVNEFDGTCYDTAYVGSTLAPLGTYILDPFNKDRTAVSGVAGLPVTTEPSRPTSVAFAAGRIFYGFKNSVLYSQVILDDFAVAGYCYQEADPTAEKINDVIATDGGVIPINDASTIFSMISWENSLFIFAANGVWALGGASIGTGFTATDFSVYKVTESGALSPRSVISILGAPMWWSKDGIYTIVGDPAKQGYSGVNITEQKLQLFYNAIPPLSKLYATGTYDNLKKVITWIYNSTDEVIGNNKYVCNRVLNYDTIAKAFYPYTLSSLTGTTPYVADVFTTLDITQTSEEEIVVDQLEHTVIDEALDPVTVDVITFGNSGNTTSLLKFFTFYQS